MIATEIEFFQNEDSKFYKLLVKPNMNEESSAIDLINKGIQKLISENSDMRYNIYNCQGNQFLKMVEF